MNPEFATFVEEFEREAVGAMCLCGASRATVFRRRDRYGIPIRPGICRRCGHVYATRQLPPAALDRFYAQTYRRIYGQGEGYLSDAYVTDRVRFSKKAIVGAVLPHIAGAPKRAVEWGCGGGWNLAGFVELGTQIVGYDHDEAFLAFGRERFGADLRRIADASSAAREFAGTVDVLIVNQVLEHVHDPFDLLATLLPMLREGGIAYVGIPTLDTIPTWGYAGFFHVAHLHYFGTDWFADTVRSLGVEIVGTDREKGVFLFVRKGPLSPGPARISSRLRANAMALARWWLRYRVIAPPARRLIDAVPGMRARVERWRGRS